MSISRLAYILLNRAKLGQKLGITRTRNYEKLRGPNDSTHAVQPSSDFT